MTLLQKVRIPLSTVMLVVFLIDYAKGLQACKYDYDIRMDIYEQYERSTDGVVSTTYQRKSDWLHEYKASRYVCFLMYFYVVPINRENQQLYGNRSVCFIYDPSINNPLPWYVKLIRPFSKRLNPPDYFVLPDAVTRLKTEHRDNLLIDKPHYLIGKVIELNFESN